MDFIITDTFFSRYKFSLHYIFYILYVNCNTPVPDSLLFKIKFFFQTNEELDKTVQRCGKVEAKSEDAHNKANVERVHIKRDLDTVREDLKKIT